jgi:hypothetical protein
MNCVHMAYQLNFSPPTTEGHTQRSEYMSYIATKTNNCKVKCLDHDFMVYKGYYDSKTGLYEYPCHKKYCPVHSKNYAQHHWHKKKAFNRGYNHFYHFNVHIFKPNCSAHLTKLVTMVRNAIKLWLPGSKCYALLHPLENDWHINFGVCCNEVVDWNDAGLSLPKDGRKRRRKFVIWGQIVEYIISLEMEYNKQCRKVDIGWKYEDDYDGWLNYCLRTFSGMKPNEFTPIGEQWKWSWGFVKKRKPKKTTVKSKECAG